MANKNGIQLALIHRKALKAEGKKINSKFGAPNNFNKSPKNYQEVYKKSLRGGGD